MLPKINRQNRNNRNIDPDIKDELESGNDLSGISNEDAEKYGDLLNPSNEANQPRIKNRGMMEKDYSSDSEDEKDDSFENEPEEMAEKLIRAADDLGNEQQEEDAENEEPASESDVLNTGFYDTLPGTGKEKGKKSSKKSSVKDSAKKGGREKKEVALTQIDESLEPVKELGIAAEKLPPRQKASWGKKLLSSIAFYSGKFIGKALGTLGTLLNMLSFGVFTKSDSWTGSWRRLFGQSFTQKKKTRKNIPGWEGAQFEERPQKNDEVSIDFRRVPDVWSYPIAVEGDIEDEKNKEERKPRPPVISVYVAQSSKQYTLDETYSGGHTSIGIEYSRKNARTGRWERYNLRYGFGNGGGMGGGNALEAVLGYSSATVPGELRNERNLDYDVSRSYTATPKQVNDVLRASETYADKGGYNQYTRNCTTFAKEMVVDVAKIRGAAPIFKMEEVYSHHKGDTALFGAGILTSYYKSDMENKFAKMNTRDDMTYQGFGNKLASEEDYKRYNKSISFFSTRTDKVYSPNGAAENMYRMEGGRSGKLGSGMAAIENRRRVQTASMEMVAGKMPAMAKHLTDVLKSITPPEKLDSENMSDEFDDLMDYLSENYIKDTLKDIPTENDDLLKAKQTDLIRYRSIFTDIINDCNTLLFKYYHNDKRVQEAILPLIDAAGHGIRNMDEAFAQTSEKDYENPEKDVKDLKSDFTDGQYMLSFTDKDGAHHDVKMTPSHYESYLQIYKTPEKAITNYAKYLDMCDAYKRGEFGENDPMYKDLLKLDRIDTLADDFDKSHRYMTDKSEFSQQDVNYAFGLSQKEQQEKVYFTRYERNNNGDIESTPVKDASSVTASNTYQMLILKTIFGDMGGRLGEQMNSKAINSANDLVRWLTEDMSGKIDENKDGMEMVLRGIKNSMKDPDKKKIGKEAVKVLSRWLLWIFKNRVNSKIREAVAEAVTNKRGPVMTKIDAMIDELLNENQQEA